MSKLKRFEVLVPYHQYLSYEVEAETADEAIALAESGFDRNGEPLNEDHSLSCGPGSQTKAKEIKE